MKKKKLNNKLFIKKSRVASLDQLNNLKGGEKTYAPDYCDFIITMGCPTNNNCPTNGCPTANNCQTGNCVTPSANCPSGNTICRCDSIITMPGITNC